MMRRIGWAGCALLLLAGCATVPNKDRTRDTTLEGYAATLRWGGFESAWSYVDPEVRAAHPLTAQQKALYKTVSIAEYDASGPIAADENTVTQIATIGLIQKNSQHVYSVVDRQTWRWDPVAKHWWLESGLPDITPER